MSCSFEDGEDATTTERVLVDTGSMDPGSCGICDDVADLDLHLVDLTADVWAHSD